MYASVMSTDYKSITILIYSSRYFRFLGWEMLWLRDKHVSVAWRWLYKWVLTEEDDRDKEDRSLWKPPGKCPSMHHLCILMKETKPSTSVIKNGFIKHELCCAPARHGQNHNQQISSHSPNPCLSTVPETEAASSGLWSVPVQSFSSNTSLAQWDQMTWP